MKCKFNRDPYPGWPGDFQDWVECETCGFTFRKEPNDEYYARKKCVEDHS